MIQLDMRVKSVSSFIIFLLFLLFSCNDKQVEKFYFPDGSLKGEQEVIDNKKNGKQIIYFPNGKVKSISYWKNDKLDGLITIYHTNGKVKSIMHWKEGKAHGASTFYYPNGKLEQKGWNSNGIKHGVQYRWYKTGVPSSIKHYMNMKGKEHLYGYIFYNKEGKVDEETTRVVTEINKDTFNLNENVSVKITLRKTQFDSTVAIIGKYDDQMNLISASGSDTIKAVNHMMTYTTKASKEGLNFIRGYVDNFVTRGDSSIHAHTYFEQRYFVKNNEN